MDSSQAKFYGILGILAVAGIGLIGYVVAQGDPQASGGSEPGAVAPTAVGDPETPVGPEVGVAKGDPSAPVTLEEYIDYQCPYCGMVAQLTVPQIVERYVETGQVHYIVFDFPVHPGDKSIRAAEAARCAGDQDAFWSMHDMLFGHMSEWSAERNPVGNFEDYAEEMGLDVDAFSECMDSRKYRDLVAANRRRGEQKMISATPTFVVDGKVLPGAASFDSLSTVIDRALAEQ